MYYEQKEEKKGLKSLLHEKSSRAKISNDNENLIIFNPYGKELSRFSLLDKEIFEKFSHVYDKKPPHLFTFFTVFVILCYRPQYI